MVEHILSVVSQFIMHTESAMGYPGLILLMAIASCCIPLPSEVIVPFAGFLCTTGHFSFWLVVVMGTVGSILGSVPAYYLGMCGGRPLVMKYGRYLLISSHDIDRADAWFARYGEATVCLGRMLPVIRAFISFPAGLNRMDMRKFLVYTTVGSFVWCLGLAYAGIALGQQMDVLKVYFHKFDALIGVVLVAGVVFWVWRHTRSNHADLPEQCDEAKPAE